MATASKTASASVEPVSRPVSAWAGTVTAKVIGTRKVRIVWSQTG